MFIYIYCPHLFLVLRMRFLQIVSISKSCNRRLNSRRTCWLWKPGVKISMIFAEGFIHYRSIQQRFLAASFIFLEMGKIFGSNHSNKIAMLIEWLIWNFQVQILKTMSFQLIWKIYLKLDKRNVTYSNKKCIYTANLYN